MASLPRTPIRLADLSNRKTSDILLEPNAEERAAVAEALGIPGIRKLRFQARLTPQGQRDWRLDATLGATVVQDCVVTLAPVTSRIDETVTRSYHSHLPEIDGVEIEMPEDDSAEELPEILDLAAVLIEALALALPPYPRAPGAVIEDAVFTAPGKAPLRDEEIRPFAGLAGLRDSLQDKEADTDSGTDSDTNPARDSAAGKSDDPDR